MSTREDPVQAIENSPLKEVIVKGFAEVYKTKPDFPIEFLGKWLKQYSCNQALKIELEATKQEKSKKVVEMEQAKKDQIEKAAQVPLTICS